MFPTELHLALYAFPGSYKELFSQSESEKICYIERTKVSKREIVAYGVETSFLEAHSNNIWVDTFKQVSM